MSSGQIPIDDNYKPVLALWDDATGKAIPVHTGSKVTGSDGNSYGKIDVSASVTASVASNGTTGSAVPASADYIGFGSGGNLTGVDTTHGLPVQAGSGALADGSLTTLGAKADAKDSHTDATAITVMQVLKQLSFYLGQALPIGISAGTSVDGNSGTIGANTQRVVSGGSATGTKSNVASSATSVTVLASNTSRKGAIFYNDSTQICYLDLSGGTASNASYSVQMPSQSYFELPGPNLYNGAVTGIWAAANGTMRVTEFS